MSSSKNREHQSDPNLAYHLSLLKIDDSDDRDDDIVLAPIFTGPVLNQSDHTPSQFGLLGGLKKLEAPGFPSFRQQLFEKDPRLFFNVSSPSSTFICGSQGSGKSHTLSCILEGCLIPSEAGRLSNPLTAVVFHYDTFICDNGGSPCEAAFLASHSQINVRVLCAPTNIRTIQRTYARFNIKVEPLQIDQANLNTKRMLDLMAVGQDKGPVPLYMHTVQRILREMRLLQQEHASQFDYQEFKRRVLDSDLLPGQLEPLKQRLETLESFMPSQQAKPPSGLNKKKGKCQRTGSSWAPKPSQLTIIDLSCPCISPDTACSLFNICFEIFMEQDTKIGRVVALDEAHKYMKDSVEARNFTDTLLSTVRLQRHLGARILISTQEPTISSDLLSLCSVTIVHRFSSPAWLHALQGHVAAAALGTQPNRETTAATEEDLAAPEISGKFSLFYRIVNLRVGEALLFSPAAALCSAAETPSSPGLSRLGAGYLVIKIRKRLTEDGGKSVTSS
ncbi:hypothetical protein N7508_007392 [Penicillium antarcticum]|uniref:uncharacterized protein n=1 Tax=Penicillium antarcticum TaxID=416450 RepID=UPI0023888719|nr:uncharacterized protein N7508_011101 [Penicillium antarcticum]XP_058317858.1 uncharacterized protein N7508_007392 [Penicillium antarcticum]KAJ5288326.1 hypothetical protein N7508_011101 [Penicillium antarcticum]KAJ5300149.1 hypothetical protein N7508_007392 [Penicillium antarcticum]